MKKTIISVLLVLFLLFGFLIVPAAADPPMPLPRMPICGDQDGTEPLEYRCVDYFHTLDVQQYQVSGGETENVELLFDFVYREASYNNELGFFKVDNTSGSIGSLNPGDLGYLVAAFERAKVIFPSGSTAYTPDISLLFNGEDILVFYIIQNNDTATFIANNPNNELNKYPLAFFSIDILNPDETDHFVGFQNLSTQVTQFGFEDMTNGGDVDYDDIVYTLSGSVEPISVAPPFTTSYYIQTKTLGTLFDLGCDQGRETLERPGTQNNIVILMFGQPATRVGANNETIYGATVYAVGFGSTVEIAGLVEQFASGYYHCSEGDRDSHLRIVVGTSNHGSQVTYDHGSKWGEMVNDIANTIISNGYSGQVDIAGGSDMEIGWNSPQITKQWVDGYASTSTRYFYNFGDSQGCPQSGSSATPGNCDRGWTQEDVWYISWGSPPAWPLPQDYNTVGSQARQWQQISLYSSFREDYTRIIISGALTQYQACQQVPNGCPGTDNSPETGWTMLWQQLNGDARTAQNLRWSTDIKWGPR